MCAIPKQVFSTASELQWNIDIIRSEREKLIRLNKDWAFYLFDNSASTGYIKENFAQEVIEAYNSINPRYGAARADLFRYCALYQEGGLYLDIKSSARKSLTDIIDNNDMYKLSQWENLPGQLHYNWGVHKGLEHIPGGEFQQWFIATPPKSRILQHIIDVVVENINAAKSKPMSPSGKQGVLCTTGPIAYTLAITQLIQANTITLGKDFEYINAAQSGLIYSIFEDNTINPSWQRTKGYEEYGCHHYSGRNEPLVRQ